MSYFQRLLVNTLTFVSLSVILPNTVFYVRSLLIALIASFVLSILNALVKPILHILSLPITLITLGLFSFVINGVMLRLTSNVVGPENLYFSGFGSAFLISIIMSIINTIVSEHNIKKYQ